MSWEVTVVELVPNVDATVTDTEIERYRQQVEHLDLLRLIEVVNAKPPRVRNRKKVVE